MLSPVHGESRWGEPLQPEDRRWLIRMWCALAGTVIFGVIGLAAVLPRQYQDVTGPLTFTEDGTFQISIFEDLHFGESTVIGSGAPLSLTNG